jgi:hypothetical protein
MTYSAVFSRIGLGLTIALAWAGHASAVTTQCVGCFAIVRSDGTLAFGHGDVSTKRIAPGAYEVNFSKPVTKCAFSATLGNDRASNNFSLVGEISVLLGSTGSKNIFVETFDSAGTDHDNPFHLVAACKPN